MTVNELINELKKCDLNAVVIMAKDEEGNDFSPCCSYSNDKRYIANSTYNGEIISREECSQPDDFDNAQKCVVLWPIN